MSSVLRWFVAVWLLALPALTEAQSSVLAAAAGSMQAGEWRVLNQAGDASGWNYALLNTGSDNILNYADKGLWNPNTHQLHFLGKGCCGQAFKFLSYSESGNAWSLEPRPYWDCSPGPNCLGHGYEHSTIDPATGDVYWRPYNSEIIYKWTRSGQSWSALPAGPNPTIATAIEYFPELGGFVLVGDGRIYLYTTADQTWTPLATGLAMGEYHNVASYNPVRQVVIFGGGNGSRKLYKLDHLRTITPIQDAPVDVGILASVLTVDPVSGRPLLFGKDGGFFEYDMSANVWSPLNTAGIPIWAPDDNKILYRVAVPVTSYGVIAFLTTYASDSDSKVFLYRHRSVDRIFEDGFGG